jgi:hypothetical protein
MAVAVIGLDYCEGSKGLWNRQNNGLFDKFRVLRHQRLLQYLVDQEIQCAIATLTRNKTVNKGQCYGTRKSKVFNL